MLEDDSSQIKNLAKDIVQKGLSIDPIVLSPTQDGSWIVREGNRRVAALKLINNPGILSGHPDEAFFKRLRDADDCKAPSEIDCMWTEDEDAIWDYVERRHKGPHKGIGIIQWSTVGKTNLMHSRGKTTRDSLALAALTLAKSMGYRPKDNQYSVTTLSRFLGTPEVRALLGIEWINGELLSRLSDDVVRSTILEVVKLIENKAARDLWKAKDRINAAKNELNLPDLSAARSSRKSIPISGQSSEGTEKGSDPQTRRESGASYSQSPYKRKRVLTMNRTKVKISKSHRKPYAIMRELAIGIESETAPLAATVLVRALLELSTRQYIESRGLRDPQEAAKRVRAVIAHMKESGLIDKDQADMFDKLATNENFYSLKTLHKYTHVDTFYPSQEFINKFWDELEPMLALCWK